jgi:hypothetical protein
MSGGSLASEELALKTWNTCHRTFMDPKGGQQSRCSFTQRNMIFSSLFRTFHVRVGLLPSLTIWAEHALSLAC